jgi:hypothetical protein
MARCDGCARYFRTGEGLTSSRTGSHETQSMPRGIESKLGTRAGAMNAAEKQNRIGTSSHRSGATTGKSKSGPRKETSAGPVKSKRRKDPS